MKAILAIGAAACFALAAVSLSPTSYAATAAKAAKPAVTATGPEATFNTECGACHMAFPAAMLPARSWTALMAGLDKHFGENAALDAPVVQEITDYLLANAADAPGITSRFERGLKPEATPLRITETPYWIARHSHEVSPAAFNKPNVKTKSNCLACHKQAASGVYGDD